MTARKLRLKGHLGSYQGRGDGGPAGSDRELTEEGEAPLNVNIGPLPPHPSFPDV